MLKMKVQLPSFGVLEIRACVLFLLLFFFFGRGDLNHLQFVIYAILTGGDSVDAHRLNYMVASW